MPGDVVSFRPSECLSLPRSVEAQPQLRLIQSTRHFQIQEAELRICRRHECERGMLAVQAKHGGDVSRLEGQTPGND
ncbi:hypothetical protein BLNAU_1193 [Blattamonas nauphoetae]|uniref:Uncharacterized protein n=1 Tax=Blattamonas nauphoetae TaxID=2049346 RepID=A0ABQ9YIP9_9EUKA|nr:hypothetical protein BLNAU_1193 [Blattamonas nauphoetae]